MKRIRGFEVVSKEHRTAKRILTDENKKKYEIDVDIQLPTRSDPRSSGYDFYVPKDVTILPGHKTIIFTDVKAYMQDDEELLLFIRSSMAIKKGLMLTNNVGKVDSSYYNNPDNDGNIGIALVNTSGIAVKLDAGDRIAQGSFYKYLTIDDDKASGERAGGFGSSGK